MSAIDSPPGVAFAGTAAGEFAARPRPRRLARRVMWLVLVTCAVTIATVIRRGPRPGAELLLVIPLVCLSVAAVGFAVRSARLRVDGAGVRWGWTELGFRVAKDKMKRVDVYTDGIAVVQTRGSTWYLSGYDWDGFGRMAGVLAEAGLPIRTHDRRAPITARLQSYGMVLDSLLVADMVASVVALGVAVTL